MANRESAAPSVNGRKMQVERREMRKWSKVRYKGRMEILGRKNLCL
jgi:hypothetical protein